MHIRRLPLLLLAALAGLLASTFVPTSLAANNRRHNRRSACTANRHGSRKHSRKQPRGCVTRKKRQPAGGGTTTTVTTTTTGTTTTGTTTTGTTTTTGGGTTTTTGGGTTTTTGTTTTGGGTTTTTGGGTTTTGTTTTGGGTTTTTGGGGTTTTTSGSLAIGTIASIAGWGDQAGMANRFDQLSAQTGAKWIREEFTWSKIEPQPGVFDFSHFDQFMLLAAQHGVHVLPLLFADPSWVGSSESVIPADPSAYAAYVAAVVKRYGPHGSFWNEHPDLASFAIQTFELWNEPYYDNGDNGDYNPARYAQLVKAASIAGRGADSSARFLIAAEMQGASSGGSYVWWVDALYQAVPDLNNYFDGVAVHPYGTDLTNVSAATPGQAYNGYDQLRRIEVIRQQFINHGASAKPFWITEIGWPTNCSDSSRCTSLAGQAANLTTVFNYATTIWKDFVQGVFVYDYTDCGTDSSNSENDYGLDYFNGTPKPALAVFKANAAL